MRIQSFLKVLLLVCLAVFLNSCIAFHSGVYYNSTHLNTNNFDYVISNAEGSSSAVYFLGVLGGTNQASLVGNAKKNLMEKYPLKTNQALANVTVNFKTAFYFGIVSVITCYMTADIVSFSDEPQQATNLKKSPENNSVSHEPKVHKDENQNIKTGDYVLFIQQITNGDKMVEQVFKGKVIMTNGEELTIKYNYKNKEQMIVKSRDQVSLTN